MVLSRVLLLGVGRGGGGVPEKTEGVYGGQAGQGVVPVTYVFVLFYLLAVADVMVVMCVQIKQCCIENELIITLTKSSLYI